MLSSRCSPSFILASVGFILLCAIYYYWGWSDVLDDFGGDNAFYLLTAQYFSPWSGHSDVAAYFASHSQYPPLYPLILAIFGGGENLLAAHLATVTLLLCVFVASYGWLRKLHVPGLIACLLILLFALMPGTYMQALAVLSENLYLFFTLVCLAAVAGYEDDGRQGWLWMAVVSVAAATLTRSAGVSLLAAFFLYLFWHRPPRFWLYAVAAMIPVIAWNLFGGQEAPGYVSSLVAMYKKDPAVLFMRQLSIEGQMLWFGWIGNFTEGVAAKPLAGFLGVLCLSGMGYRFYLRRLDGFYSAAYLALILVWPFPAEAQRLLFAIMPVLLVQGVLLLELIPSLKISRVAIRPVYILFLAVSLIILPDLALTIERFLGPAPEEFADYRRTPGWYAIDPNEAHLNVAANKLLAAHLGSLSTVVAKGECIYGIKPSIVGYYSGHVSMIPPRPHFDQTEFDAYLQKKNCRYFYMMGFLSPSFPEAYYPLRRLRASLRIVSVAQPVDRRSDPIGMLAELERR